jgi:predicted amidohydrolase
VRVAAFQFDVLRGEVAANLAAVELALALAAEQGVELVVLPEMWPTSFVAEVDGRLLAESDAAVARVGARSRELGLIVAGSAFATREAAPGALPRNRLTVFARGERVLIYDKLHLFSPTAEHEGFSAGDELPPTVALDRIKLSGCVCYDLRFGAGLRAPFLAAAELLVVPAQWPGSRATQWRALLCGRAAEHQAFVVAANRTGRDRVGRRGLPLEFIGNSLVVGPDGGVLAEGRGGDGLVTAELDLEELRSLRRAVPVRRDERRDLVGGIPCDDADAGG